MKDTIRKLVREAVETAMRKGALPPEAVDSFAVEVTRAKEPRFGDYATNAALVLAARAGMNPREVAGILTDNLSRGDVIEKAEVAGPGFINFFLTSKVWRDVLYSIHHARERYGHADPMNGPKVLLEFVSANPTGPLHVGHGRGAAVGDTLARLLKARGYRVETEYYVNDAGNQMRILGRSVLFRFRELRGETISFPDDHYRGSYIADLASEIMGTQLAEDLLSMTEEQAVDAVGRFACRRILDGIQNDLDFFGVSYDSYFSERTLYEHDKVAQTVEELRRRGRAEEKDGAIWFSMDSAEDDKDRVLVRATGEPTYFAADAAYHLDKLGRGYDLLIDIWGSDHHGYVPRVRAAIEALGYSPNALKVILVQFVTLVREGKKLSMSTRSGEFITLRDVLDEVGPDAARFFFLTKRADSHLDFDMDLAKKQSRDNPVYYVQYAHARVSSIFRIAAERGIDADLTDPDITALTLPEEQRLIKHLADYPDVLAEAAESVEPHRITFYLMDLAELFHAYYHDNRVLLEDPVVKKARLYLVEAVRLVVANGLRILGVAAPERM
ncbi:MAG: arginine--tRNA ligase [Desulfomonile sp.]|nr:arginine--tRNA ligase [Desulfomonile sp.]